MTIGLDVDVRNSRLQKIIDAIDAEGDEYEAGSLTIYAGTRPATGAALDEYDVALVKFALPIPCGTISGGVLTFNAIPDAYAIATEEATWARITDADDNFVADLSATDYLGGGDVRIDDVNIEVGGLIHCIAATITEGNA